MEIKSVGVCGGVALIDACSAACCLIHQATGIGCAATA